MCCLDYGSRVRRREYYVCASQLPVPESSVVPLRVCAQKWLYLFSVYFFSALQEYICITMYVSKAHCQAKCFVAEFLLPHSLNGDMFRFTSLTLQKIVFVFVFMCVKNGVKEIRIKIQFQSLLCINQNLIWQFPLTYNYQRMISFTAK